MKLVGSGEQQVAHYLYDASGTLAGSGAQLLLPRSPSRSLLLIQNISAHVMNLEFGAGRATATLTSGKVTSVAVTNAGFGFTKPPIVQFLGGGNPGNSSYIGLGLAGGMAPQKPAIGRAVLTGAAGSATISSIVVDDGGAGYITAPFVFLRNSDLDPNGCTVPSATVGILLAASGGQLLLNGTACPTDPIGIIGTSGDAFVCKWMT